MLPSTFTLSDLPVTNILSFLSPIGLLIITTIISGLEIAKLNEMKTRAIVSYSPKNGEAKFQLESVFLRETQPNELFIEMVASGICGTDIFFAETYEGILGPFPRVLGHEGVGWVRAVGQNVRIAAVGDAVSLSFASCRKCQPCSNSHPGYCTNFAVVNYGATIAYQMSGGQDLPGYFFGQSSFANHSNVPESSVVNISHLITEERDMHAYAAMGCSFQAGSATITKLAGARKEDSVVIMGVGAVGLSAIMAAKICRCSPIIAVDLHETRLQMARELGATHVINTSIDSVDLAAEIQTITNGNGPTITVDTTGSPALCKDGLDFTADNGKMILLGTPPLDAEFNIGNLVGFIKSGKSLVGSMEGDAIPGKMIRWFKSGIFPIDRLVKTYKVENFEVAISDMKAGSTIKPVLLWK